MLGRANSQPWFRVVAGLVNPLVLSHPQHLGKLSCSALPSSPGAAGPTLPSAAAGEGQEQLSHSHDTGMEEWRSGGGHGSLAHTTL